MKIKIPEVCGVLTRSMTKKLQQNNNSQQVLVTKIDTKIKEAVKKRETLLKKRREKRKKAFDKQQSLKTKQKKNTNKRQKVTVQNDNLSVETTAVLPPSSTIAVEVTDVKQLPQNQIKDSEPVQEDNNTELMSLNLNKYDSDSEEYDCKSSRIVTNWVSRREYDSKHAKNPILLDLFCTGPCLPEIKEIFNEVEEQQLLRNSSIWED